MEGVNVLKSERTKKLVKILLNALLQFFLGRF